MKYDDLLLELNSDPRWIGLINEILKHRPSIPQFNHQNDNTADWKARSSERKGFDIWLTFLKIKDTTGVNHG